MWDSRKRSRVYLSLLALLLLAVALLVAFWPRPTLIDIGEVNRGPMRLTIDDEGRTRVRDAYMVSTPVAGRLLRVQLDPGATVHKGDTVIAYMRPSNPAALDVRTREQARALVAAADASLRVARADLNAAIANRDLARSEQDRTGQLARQGMTTEAAVDRTRQEARVAQAHVDTAEAAIAMRQAELANAQAQLIGFDDQGMNAATASGEGDIPILAPASGSVLRILQQSETTLPAGTPIMEIGDINGNLEVVVDLLSTDAVQVSAGQRVFMDDWGGEGLIDGEVLRVDPFAFTRFSALGVEEQRVNTVIRLISDAESYRGLGHGFRIETRIVVWESDDSLIVPASALFRERGEWAVFRVDEGRTVLQSIQAGRNNGVQAQVLEGLDEDDQVVLYPSSDLSAGQRVQQRRID
ncbi:efflux RND transporter periplasmic adaptor subunit [Granulosicoccus sp. 3-233]|uniref:efflux RND transporter periplasmic adaptor subunit n=1 Tax=Granulosicoccus sp. 3-233 TaxID=3417969 RepID=UPI003D32C27C